MNKLIAPPNEYISPSVEILEIEVENGFANSDGVPPGFGEDRHFGPF